MSNCTRCGRPADYENLELGYAYCERCEDDFQASMREQFPYGQCHTCGCRYEKYEQPCESCYGLGVKPVLAADGVGVEWATCAVCENTGSVSVVDGLHEEALCGLREPWMEAVWCSLGRMPTQDDVLGWFIENQARREHDLALASLNAAARRDGAEVDIPF